ncbi:hypothetical protein [Rosenbergiella australiborealis]|uniref:hypothetical protein n=1 Tax=Rosenbergiella australiborealis TaxID=1544696 RepID=UPI001F4E016E|nr:hypothetical protein [Rosenbergiella australiborealis]
MITLFIDNQTHKLSIEEAKNLALSIAHEVDGTGGVQSFNTQSHRFSVKRSKGAETPAQPAPSKLTNC